jgi:transcriptional regulator with XRE-family HTH domain
MVINGPALRAIRERSLMTQESLAKAAGMDRAALSNIENGKRNASPELAVALAKALKVELPAILADPAEVQS